MKATVVTDIILWHLWAGWLSKTQVAGGRKHREVVNAVAI